LSGYCIWVAMVLLSVSCTIGWES